MQSSLQEGTENEPNVLYHGHTPPVMSDHDAEAFPQRFLVVLCSEAFI